MHGSTGEAEIEGSEVYGYSQIHREFEVSLNVIYKILREGVKKDLHNLSLNLYLLLQPLSSWDVRYIAVLLETAFILQWYFLSVRLCVCVCTRTYNISTGN